MKLAIVILVLLGGVGDSFTRIAKENSVKKEAETAYLKGDYKTATQKYSYLTDSLHVNDDNALLNLGHSYFKMAQSIEAAKVYEKLYSSADKDVKSVAAQQLGVLSYKEDHDKVKALVYFKEALKANPQNKEARYNYELLKKTVDKKEDPKMDNKQNKKDDQKKEEEKKNEEKKDQQNKDQQGKDKQDQNQQQNKDNKQQQNQGDNSKNDQKDQKGNKNDKDKKGGDKEQKGDNKSDKDGKDSKDNKDVNKDSAEKKGDKNGSEKENGGKEKQDKEKAKQDQQGENVQGKDDKKQGKENDMGQAMKEKEGGKKGKDKVVVNPEMLAKMGITQQRAQSILNAMKGNEIQYIQQMKRESAKKQKKGKPEW